MFLYKNKEEYIDLLFSYAKRASNDDYLISFDLGTKENLDRIFNSKELLIDLAILLLVQEAQRHTPLDRVNMLNEMLACDQITAEEFYDVLFNEGELLQVFLQLK